MGSWPVVGASRVAMRVVSPGRVGACVLFIVLVSITWARVDGAAGIVADACRVTGGGWAAGIAADACRVGGGGGTP